MPFYIYFIAFILYQIFANSLLLSNFSQAHDIRAHFYHFIHHGLSPAFSTLFFWHKHVYFHQIASIFHYFYIFQQITYNSFQSSYFQALAQRIQTNFSYFCKMSSHNANIGANIKDNSISFNKSNILKIFSFLFVLNHNK